MDDKGNGTACAERRRVLSLNVSGDSPMVTNVLETRQFYPPGEFVKIRVKVSRKRQASGGWVITGGIPAKVSAQITTPDGRTDALALYDDGKHADGKAGDGVFGGVYTKTSKEGDYEVKISITGPVTRTIMWGFSVDKRAGDPGNIGLGGEAVEVPWKKVRITVLGVTQKLANVSLARSLTLRHKASGFSMTKSGEFLCQSLHSLVESSVCGILL